MVISKPSERMLIAMSGGVDSSVAALLMKNEGKKAVGVILRMHDVGMTAEELSGGKLPVNIWSAREAARRIRMEFNIIDVRDDFTEKVKERFLGIYKQGIITDPCVFCNAEFKIPFLIETAKKMDCGKIVTGHYAKTELDEKTGRYILRKARDRENDQSYMLYRLSQEQLSKLVTPLGYMKKSDVRHMAEEARLKNANAPGSAEICFIPDNDIAAYAEKNTDFREEKLMRAAAGSSKNMRVSRVNFVSIDAVDETEGKAFTLWPNPAFQTIYIDGVEVVEVQVYNALGQVVKTMRGTNEITVAELPQGVYLVQIADAEGKVLTAKVAVGR